MSFYNTGCKKIIICTLALATVIGVAGCKSNDSESDNIRVSVKDAAENSNGSITSPYKMSKESFEDVLSSNEYLKKQFKLETSYEESFEADQSNAQYRCRNVYDITGYPIEDNSKQQFIGKLTSYNNFDCPSAVSLMYTYSDKKDIEDVDSSAREVFTQLFNKDVAEAVIANKSSYVEYSSKSGKYTLKITKSSYSVSDDVNEALYSVSYEQSDEFILKINDYKPGSDILPIYNNSQYFKGNITDVDFGKEFSDLYGNSVGRAVTSINSTYSENEDGTKTYTADLSMEHDFENSIICNSTYSVIVDKDASENIIDTVTELNTSTLYEKSTKDAMDKAVKIVNSVFGVNISMSDSDYSNGEYNQKVTYTKGIARITISVSSDENGYYASIDVMAESK